MSSYLRNERNLNTWSSLVILVTPSQHIPTMLRYPKHSHPSHPPGALIMICLVLVVVSAPSVRQGVSSVWLQKSDATSQVWSHGPRMCPFHVLKILHLTVLQLTCSICATCFASFESGQWFNRRDLVQRSSMVNCEAEMLPGLDLQEQTESHHRISSPLHWHLRDLNQHR